MKNRTSPLSAPTVPMGWLTRSRSIPISLRILVESAPPCLTKEQHAILNSLADDLVETLLATPTNRLRAAAENDDWLTATVVLQLFDPSLDLDSVDR